MFFNFSEIEIFHNLTYFTLLETETDFLLLLFPFNWLGSFVPLLSLFVFDRSIFRTSSYYKILV